MSVLDLLLRSGQPFPLFVLCIVAVAMLGVVLSEARSRRITGTVRAAIRLSDSTMRQAAQEAEIDQAQFQRQIELVEGSLKRLGMQRDEFWQWWAVTIAEEFGMPRVAQRAARMALASAWRRRMARMTTLRASERSDGAERRDLREVRNEAIR